MLNFSSLPISEKLKLHNIIVSLWNKGEKVERKTLLIIQMLSVKAYLRKSTKISIQKTKPAFQTTVTISKSLYRSTKLELSPTQKSLKVDIEKTSIFKKRDVFMYKVTTIPLGKQYPGIQITSNRNNGTCMLYTVCCSGDVIVYTINITPQTTI